MSYQTCTCGCGGSLIKHYQKQCAFIGLKPLRLQATEVVEVYEPPKEIIYKGFRYVLKSEQ